MKTTYNIILLLFATVLLAGCEKLKGDNADYPWGHNFDEDNIYENGYERIPGTYRLATYNVHVCAPIGSSSGNYNNIAKVISLIDPDVIAIQELDRNNDRNNTDQLEELARRTGMDSYYGKTIDFRNGEYGNGLLYSKDLNLRSVANIPLPGASEARGAIVAEFDEFIFIATHLSLTQAERKESREIIDAYLTQNFPAWTRPIFLAGDLNESSLTSEFFLDFIKHWEVISVNEYTYIGSSNYARIDYIAVSTSNGAGCEVVGSAVPTFEEIDVFKCSDHLPVFTDVKK